MYKDEIIKEIKRLSDEEKKALIEELKALLPKKKRRIVITDEAKRLVEELISIRERAKEIRNRLKEMGMLRLMSHRVSPLYNIIKDIIFEHRIISLDNLANELKKRGYKFSGSTGVILRIMNEEGLIRKEGDRIIWQGKE